MTRHTIATLTALAIAGCMRSPGHTSDPELHTAACADYVHGVFFSSLPTHLKDAGPEIRAAQIDSLLINGPSPPWIGADSASACFVYHGSAHSVHLAGDFNSWTPHRSPMRRIEETDLWLLDATFEPNARIEYKFVVDEASWILDPLNPRHSEGGFGANSELAMPDHVPPWEIISDASIPQGALQQHTIRSRALQQQRIYHVYTPPGYDSDPTRHFPLIFFHDGGDYLAFARAQTILDNLVAARRIEPLVTVFVPPVERNDEYAFGLAEGYVRFVTEELVPAIDAAYRTETDPSRRLMTGPSLGGLVTTRLCYARPDLFGLCAPISPAYWPNDGAVMRAVVDGPVKPIRWYIDWGVYEIVNWEDPPSPHPHSAPRMKDLLLQAGYEVHWNEWPEGHSWGSWRAHLDAMLETFFPGNALMP